MIDEKYREQMFGEFELIDASEFSPDERQILKAAVITMADGFSDVAYDEIPQTPTRHARGDLLEFFMNGVRWHWAAEFGNRRAESWSTMHAAVKCPFSDIRIDQIIRRYESLYGPIWDADQSQRTAEHDRYKRDRSVAHG